MAATTTHEPRCRRKGGQCMQLRVADQQYVNLSDLGTRDKPHDSDCAELSLVVAGRPTPARFALKSAHEDTEHARQSFKNEKQALQLCGSSPFVPSLLRSDERNLCLVQELASFDLSRIATGGLPLSWVRWVSASMVLALEHVHAQRIVHLDIKMDNILLSHDGRPLLADFGCSLHLPTLDSRVALPSFRGTPRFGAPEMLEELEDGSWRHVAGRAADLWALGVTIYRSMFGVFPDSHATAGSGAEADDLLVRMQTASKAVRFLDFRQFGDCFMADCGLFGPQVREPLQEPPNLQVGLHAILTNVLVF